jgi:hypothetical protein
VESHTTVIIPLDDHVIFVRLLNRTQFSGRLSEVTQTLDAIFGMQFLSVAESSAGRSLSPPLRPNMTRAAGELVQFGKRFIGHKFLIASEQITQAKNHPHRRWVDDHGATPWGRTKSSRVDEKDEKDSTFVNRKSSQRIYRLS